MMISVRKLGKNFGKQRVLEGLDLSVSPGEVVALVGKNGCGKSTLIQAIAGLIPVDTGTVLIDEVPIGIRYHRMLRRVGFVFDQPIYVEGFSGWKYLEFVGRLYGFDKTESQRRATELVEFFDLPTGRKKIADYSKGMKKKVSFAAALVHRPMYLVLDEPFDGMDAATVLKAIEQLRELALQGTGVLLVTHHNGLIRDLATAVATMEQGKISQVRPVEDWWQELPILQRSEVLTAFLGN
ncbi:ABC transporter, ATP-binding protein [Lunatimonas lonarensis]|uniref:ABC transporter, ATP-binding protein n=1 Tax=Lunatimonas lonarensis TaxID=1232681 RepID=R7ZQ20_9BACT|nr:ABC transporter ATP-binding protein [Lunatimonas lonarensis]EON76187.1 ABC transporter, ATP-binding protein [Lunatimonas lonarensis]